jgi:hypothetical protein
LNTQPIGHTKYHFGKARETCACSLRWSLRKVRALARQRARHWVSRKPQPTSSAQGALCVFLSAPTDTVPLNQAIVNSAIHIYGPGSSNWVKSLSERDAPTDLGASWSNRLETKPETWLSAALANHRCASRNSKEKHRLTALALWERCLASYTSTLNCCPYLKREAFVPVQDESWAPMMWVLNPARSSKQQHFNMHVRPLMNSDTSVTRLRYAWHHDRCRHRVDSSLGLFPVCLSCSPEPEQTMRAFVCESAFTVRLEWN